MIQASFSDGKFERDRDHKRNRMLLEIGDKKYHLTQQEAQILKDEIEEYLQAILALKNEENRPE